MLGRGSVRNGSGRRLRPRREMLRATHGTAVTRSLTAREEKQVSKREEDENMLISVVREGCIL